MRSVRQQRVGGTTNLDRAARSGNSNLHALEGRGLARTCRLTAPGGQPTLMLRHYGLDRTAFAVGAVQAARFLAERVAEGAPQRVYDMVDVLRDLQAKEEAKRAARAASTPQYTSNVVAVGPIVNAAVAV
jgi:4-hydroxy-tetrahydrodipicolinate reductase